jgi:hypothetical protein
MADELDLSAEQPSAIPTPNIADKATTELARGRMLLEAQINKLMSSLDRRKNQTFDPMKLRMAQGFLAPTKTGRFGESLSNVAGGVAEEQAKQQAYDEQTDKLKLELQQKMYEMQSDATGSDMMRQAVTGQLGPKAQQIAKIPSVGMSAPVGAVQPTSIQDVPVAPPVAPQSTQNATTEQALQIAVNNPSALEKITMTPDMVQMFYSLPGGAGKKYGEMADKIFNNQRQMAELGIKESELANKTREINTKQVPVRSPYDPDREMQMSTTDYNKYLQLDFNDNKAVNTFLRSHGLGAYAIGAEGTSGTGSTGSGSGVKGMTKAEQELENKLKEKREGVKIDQDNAAVTSMRASAEVAQGMKQDARAIYGYASNPKTSNAFGLLSKAGIGEAILSAAEEGIRVGPYNIGINNLTTRILQARGTQDEVNAALALGRNISQLELGYTRMFLKGEGAITEGERAIVRRIPPGIADSPKTAMLKSEMIMARSTFDEQKNAIYDKWVESNPTGLYSQFKNSPSYKELSKHYDNKIKQLDKKYL